MGWWLHKRSNMNGTNYLSLPCQHFLAPPAVSVCRAPVLMRHADKWPLHPFIVVVTTAASAHMPCWPDWCQDNTPLLRGQWNWLGAVGIRHTMDSAKHQGVRYKHKQWQMWTEPSMFLFPYSENFCYLSVYIQFWNLLLRHSGVFSVLVVGMSWQTISFLYLEVHFTFWI